MDTTPVAPNLAQIMCHASQTPLTTDVVEAPQQKPTEPTCCFALPTHRLHDHLASGVQGLACRPPHLRRHACLRAGRLLKHRRLWLGVALTPGGPGRIN